MCCNNPISTWVCIVESFVENYGLVQSSAPTWRIHGHCCALRVSPFTCIAESHPSGCHHPKSMHRLVLQHWFADFSGVFKFCYWQNCHCGMTLDHQLILTIDHHRPPLANMKPAGICWDYDNKAEVWSRSISFWAPKKVDKLNTLTPIQTGPWQP